MKTSGLLLLLVFLVASGVAADKSADEDGIEGAWSSQTRLAPCCDLEPAWPCEVCALLFSHAGAEQEKLGPKREFASICTIEGLPCMISPGTPCMDPLGRRQGGMRSHGLTSSQHRRALLIYEVMSVGIELTTLATTYNFQPFNAVLQRTG